MNPLYTLFLFCFFQTLVIAQSSTQPPWAEGRFFPVKKDQHWGVVQHSGELTIAPKYQSIQFGLPYGDTLYPYFLVQVAEDKWGVLDTLGEEVLAPIYCDIEIVQPKTPYFSTRTHCGDPVQLEVSKKIKRSISIASLRVTGEELEQFKAVPDADSLLYKIDRNGLVGVQNIRSGEVLPTQFDSIEVLPKKEYVLTRRRGPIGEDLYALYFMNGEEWLPSRYEGFLELPADFIALRDTADHLWYVHHIDGFELQRGYKGIKPYSSGFRLRHANQPADKEGKGYDFFIPEERIIRKNLYYDAFSLFGPYMAYIKRGRFGVVDDIGMDMLPPVFTHLKHIGKGYLEASMKTFGRESRGVITIMGERIVPPEYKSVEWFKDKVLYAKSSDGFMLYDAQGNCLSSDGPYNDMVEVKEDQYKVFKVGKRGYGLLYLYEDEVLLDWYSNTRTLSNSSTKRLGLSSTLLAPPVVAPTVVEPLRTDTIGQLQFSSRLLDVKGPLYAPWKVQLAADAKPLPLGEIRELQFPSAGGQYLRYSLFFFDEQANSFKKRQYLLDAAKAQVITAPIFSEIAASEVGPLKRPFFMGKLANEEGQTLIDSTGKILATGISKIEQQKHFIQAHHLSGDYSLFLDYQAKLLMDSVERREAVDWAGLFEVQQVNKPFFSLVDSTFELRLDSLLFIDRRKGFFLAQFEGQQYHSLLDTQLNVVLEKVNTIHQENGLTFLKMEEQDYRTLIRESGEVLADSITDAWKHGNFYLVKHIDRPGLSLLNEEGQCFLSGILSYEEGEEGHLSVALKKGADVQYGLIDGTGNWVISPQYQDLTALRDGWLIASIEGGKTGIIDTNANWIVEPTKDYILPLNKNTGLAGFMIRREPEQQGWKILQYNGDYLIPESFERLSPVYESHFLAKKEDKWGMLWTSGETRLPFHYDAILPYRAGFAPAKKAAGWGLLDEKGAVRIDFGYADFGTHFGDYFPIKKEEKWGLLKEGTNLILPCAFDSIRYHKNGLVQAATKHGWRLFDTSGNRLLRRKFQEISGFNVLGMAQTRMHKKLGLINDRGQQLLRPRYEDIRYLDSSGFILARKGKHWGLWDTTGHRLSKTRYRSIQPFNAWGLAKAYTPKGNMHLVHQELGKLAVRLEQVAAFDRTGNAIAQRKTLWPKPSWGLLNASGEWSIEPRYERLEVSEQGWVWAERNAKKGLFSKTGETIIAVAYDEIKRNCQTNTYRVRKGSQWGVLNAQGEWISPPQFNGVSDFIYTDSVACVQMDNNLFALTRKGALLKWSDKWRKLPRAKPAPETYSEKEAKEDAKAVKYTVAEQSKSLFPFGKTQVMQPFLIGEDTMHFNLMRVSGPRLRVWASADSSNLVSSQPLYQLLAHSNWGLQARSSAKYREMALLSADLAAAGRPYEREVVFKDGTEIPNGPFDFVEYMGAGVFRLEQGQRLGYWQKGRGWLWPLQE